MFARVYVCMYVCNVCVYVCIYVDQSNGIHLLTALHACVYENDDMPFLLLFHIFQERLPQYSPTIVCR